MTAAESMFVILDTNDFQELVRATSLGLRLQERIAAADADAFTTVVNAQEIAQGWTAEINRRKAGRDEVRIT